MKVIVYSTETCPYCIMLIKFLKENNIKFEEKDINQDGNATKEMVEKSGQIGVPVIDIDGEIIIGFDKERLKKVLKL